MIHVIGEILVDIFDDGLKKEVFPGGAPFNLATNVAHFGGNVSFYGCVGNDEYGSFLKKFAKKSHIKPLILKTSKTRETSQAVITLNNAERSFRFIRDNGADYTLRLKNVEKMNIKKGDIVHIGSLMLSFPNSRNFFFKMVKLIKEKQALMSFDINYRDDIFDNRKQAKRIFKKAIKYADILKISSEELDVLSPRKTFKSSVKFLVKKDQIAFISRGELGSCAYVNGSYVFQDTKFVKPVDTTGAGDAFYSYILYELDKNNLFLSNQEKLKEILFRANIVGAMATLKKGAINVVPSIKELNSCLKELK